jgi:hypothetical protein
LMSAQPLDAETRSALYRILLPFGDCVSVLGRISPRDRWQDQPYEPVSSCFYRALQEPDRRRRAHPTENTGPVACSEHSALLSLLGHDVCYGKILRCAGSSLHEHSGSFGFLMKTPAQLTTYILKAPTMLHVCSANPISRARSFSMPQPRSSSTSVRHSKSHSVHRRDAPLAQNHVLARTDFRATPLQNP